MSGAGAQLVDAQKPWIPSTELHSVVVHTVIPALRLWRQKDQMFKVIPSYLVIFRPVWVM